MKGVLDRFEDEQSVILIEDHNKEIIVHKSELPETSVVGTWFDIEVQQDAYKLTIDPDKTAEMKQKSANLKAKLRAKSSGSKFKKR